MVEVRLGTTVLPTDHKILKFFPGQSYKFYDLVAEAEIVFLDVRGLDRLGPDPLQWKPSDILVKISEDRVQRSVNKGKERPGRLMHSVGDKATATYLNSLLLIAKKGDLVIMPARGYTTLVKIGQLIDEPGVVTYVTAADEGVKSRYAGRRVKWLSEIEKRNLPSALINLLQTQAAVFDIGQRFYDVIYQIAFANYVFDGNYVSTFTTSKRIFTSKDNLLTSVWFELMEVLNESHQSGSQLRFTSVSDLALASNIPEDERDDLSIRIESPGWFRKRSSTISPVIASVLLILAANNTSWADAQTVQVSATIIPGADNKCIGEVEQSVRAYLQILGEKGWESACQLAVKAEQEATLKVKGSLHKSKKSGKVRR